MVTGLPGWFRDLGSFHLVAPLCPGDFGSSAGPLTWWLKSKECRGLCALLPGGSPGGEIDHFPSYSIGHTQPAGEAGKCTVAFVQLEEETAKHTAVLYQSLPFTVFWNCLSLVYHSLLVSVFKPWLIVFSVSFTAPLSFFHPSMLVSPSIYLLTHFPFHYIILPRRFHKQPEHPSPSFCSYPHVKLLLLLQVPIFISGHLLSHWTRTPEKSEKCSYIPPLSSTAELSQPPHTTDISGWELSCALQDV